MSIELRYSLLALLAAVISAAYWVLTEVTVNYFAVPSIVAAMWGGMLGGLMLLALAGRRGSLRVDAWGRADWTRMVVGGLLIHGAGFVLTFLATSLIGAGKANLLGQIQTFFVVILAVIFLGERFTRRQTAGVALALAGVILLNFDRSAMWVTWGTGETLTLLARLMIAVGIVVMKPLFDHGNAAGSTGVAMVVGALFLFAAYPFSRAGVSGISGGWIPVLLILTLASGRGIAWLCFNASQQYIGASRAAIIFLSVSFFAVFFQLLVAWRAPGLGVQVPHDLGMALAGGLLVAAGIVVLQR
ncbi:MAG: DMT family transporter [Caldilineaceae bacterium]|nr:DMT family transporter [Caldilineaceae bacterium]